MLLHFVGGIEYKNSVLEAIYHSEGRLYKNASTWQYEYSLKDHLGNTRLTFADTDNNGTISTSEILQENHYYPFGLNQEGAFYNNTALPDSKYQYNGKELNEDLGLNWNDYGARWYDASIGRWGQIDPLGEKYINSSPYNYVDANPLARIDPDGMDWIYATYTYKNKDGENQTGIRLTFKGAVLNSSSNKKFDTQGFIEEQAKIFKDVFGQGNVDFVFDVKEIQSKDELGEFDHLIEIKDAVYNEEGKAQEGRGDLGSKYIELDKSYTQKRTLVHEAGHTGGLLHPSQLKELNKAGNTEINYRNGKTYNISTQSDVLQKNDDNFMGYPGLYLEKKGIDATTPNLLRQAKYVSKATKGQIQTIINNIREGNINLKKP